MGKIILFVFSLILFSCKISTTKNETNVVSEEFNTINIITHIESSPSELLLSESVSNIEIVPLEITNHSLISKITKVVVSESDIFISDNRDISVFHFDRKGEFLNRIGNKGQGNGEYLNRIDYGINEISKEVYILSTNGVLVYDYNGNYKRNYNATAPHKLFSQIQTGIEVYDNRTFFKQSGGLWFTDTHPKDSLWSLALINNEGSCEKLFLNPAHIGHEEEIKKLSAPLSGWRNYWTEEEPCINYYDTVFWLKYPDVDTLYKYDKNIEDWKAAYAIDLGSKKAKNYIDSHMWIKNREVFNDLFIKSAYHTKAHIYLVGSMDETIYTIRYTKDNGCIQLSKRGEKIITKKFPKMPESYKRIDRSFILTNDLTGGVFRVDYAGKHEWIFVIDQDVLNELVITDNNSSNNEKGSILHEMINNLGKEDSNPILLIANSK